MYLCERQGANDDDTMISRAKTQGARQAGPWQCTQQRCGVVQMVSACARSCFLCCAQDSGVARRNMRVLVSGPSKGGAARGTTVPARLVQGHGCLGLCGGAQGMVGARVHVRVVRGKKGALMQHIRTSYSTRGPTLSSACLFLLRQGRWRRTRQGWGRLGRS